MTRCPNIGLLPADINGTVYENVPCFSLSSGLISAKCMENNGYLMWSEIVSTCCKKNN